MSKYTHARTAVYNTGYHLVWSTKYRRSVLVGEVEEHLKEILFAVAENNGFVIKEMEVMPDHVHVFVSAHPKHAPGHIYKLLKGISARKLFLQHPEISEKLWKGQLWNPSTFTETVGHISEEMVKRYIQDQKKA
jgi:putative transposase